MYDFIFIYRLKMLRFKDPSDLLIAIMERVKIQTQICSMPEPKFITSIIH